VAAITACATAAANGIGCRTALRGKACAHGKAAGAAATANRLGEHGNRARALRRDQAVIGEGDQTTLTARAAGPAPDGRFRLAFKADRAAGRKAARAAPAAD